MSQREARRRAATATLRAARAWLLGKALAAHVDELRVAHEVDPIPAPGLESLVARLDEDFRDVSALSDRVATLLADPGQISGIGGRVAVDIDAADQGAGEAERVSRRIAQLALGVRAGLGPGERTELLERAAVAVLCREHRSDSVGSLSDDGIELFGTKKQELRVELRGLIWRMLMERNATVRVGKVRLRIESSEIVLQADDIEQKWTGYDEVSDAARAAAKAIKASGMSTKQIRNSAVVE